MCAASHLSPGPSDGCSKHLSLMSSLRGQLVKCYYDFITKYTDIFVEKKNEESFIFHQ